MNDKQRDRDWLGTLFDEHHTALLAYAIRRVGHDRAEDVVAEVFATVWRRRHDVPESPRAWLYAVTRNEVLHAHRSQQRQANLVDAAKWHCRGEGTEDHVRFEIDSVLDQLEPTDAEVLRLTVWEQLTPSEIAEVLGISAPAARQRLLRARNKAQMLHEFRTQRPQTA